MHRYPCSAPAHDFVARLARIERRHQSLTLGNAYGIDFAAIRSARLQRLNRAYQLKDNIDRAPTFDATVLRDLLDICLQAAIDDALHALTERCRRANQAWLEGARPACDSQRLVLDCTGLVKRRTEQALRDLRDHRVSPFAQTTLHRLERLLDTAVSALNATRQRLLAAPIEQDLHALLELERHAARSTSAGETVGTPQR